MALPISSVGRPTHRNHGGKSSSRGVVARSGRQEVSTSSQSQKEHFISQLPVAGLATKCLRWMNKYWNWWSFYYRTKSRLISALGIKWGPSGAGPVSPLHTHRLHATSAPVSRALSCQVHRVVSLLDLDSHRCHLESPWTTNIWVGMWCLLMLRIFDFYL